MSSDPIWILVPLIIIQKATLVHCTCSSQTFRYFCPKFCRLKDNEFAMSKHSQVSYDLCNEYSAGSQSEAAFENRGYLSMFLSQDTFSNANPRYVKTLLSIDSSYPLQNLLTTAYFCTFSTDTQITFCRSENHFCANLSYEICVFTPRNGTLLPVTILYAGNKYQSDWRECLFIFFHLHTFRHYDYSSFLVVFLPNTLLN